MSSLVTDFNSSTAQEIVKWATTADGCVFGISYLIAIGVQYMLCPWTPLGVALRPTLAFPCVDFSKCAGAPGRRGIGENFQSTELRGAYGTFVIVEPYRSFRRPGATAFTAGQTLPHRRTEYKRRRRDNFGVVYAAVVTVWGNEPSAAE